MSDWHPRPSLWVAHVLGWRLYISHTPLPSSGRARQCQHHIPFEALQWLLHRY